MVNVNSGITGGVLYGTKDGTMFERIGEITEADLVTEDEEQRAYPDITISNNEWTITIELTRKAKKAWAKVFDMMPKYRLTEWANPKKKKRGTIRRQRRR
jgi:hypothetical protein